jgi:hypothetical protein
MRLVRGLRNSAMGRARPVRKPVDCWTVEEDLVFRTVSPTGLDTIAEPAKLGKLLLH